MRLAIPVIAIVLLLTACVSKSEAEHSVRRFADHTPGATGFECGGNEGGYRYCTIWRKDASPLSLRCDEDTCTSMADNSTTVAVPVVVHH
jgi:hypothetical protein